MSIIKESFLYNIYGLNIESEIKIPEFQSSEGRFKNKEVVTMIKSVVPEHVKSAVDCGNTVHISREEIWFNIKDVGIYYVTNGKSIIVEPCEGVDENLLNVYLMCSCLGFIMLQRDKVAIHGGTIIMDNKGIIITGERGAGKSTLTTALRLKGYKFLADDVAATSFHEIPMINPGFPYQKLCEDAAEKLGYDKEANRSFVADGKLKYIVPAYEDFIDNNIEFGALCEVVVGDVEEVQIEEIKGYEKLNKLNKNIYRGEFMSHLGGMNNVYFKKCIDLARCIKCYKITRPRNKFTVDKQIDILENIFLNH